MDYFIIHITNWSYLDNDWRPGKTIQLFSLSIALLSNTRKLPRWDHNLWSTFERRYHNLEKIYLYIKVEKAIYISVGNQNQYLELEVRVKKLSMCSLYELISAIMLKGYLAIRIHEFRAKIQDHRKCDRFVHILKSCHHLTRDRT